MVETRGRRKSVAPTAAASPAATNAGRGAGGGEAAPPSTSGRRAAEVPVRQQHGGKAAAADGSDYIAAYREAARQAKQAEQANILRRLQGRVHLLYHQQAMTWGWYMLEPWEIVLWMATLLFLCWLVVSACFLNPSSICGSTLAAAHKALAAQGAKLLAFLRVMRA